MATTNTNVVTIEELGITYELPEDFSINSGKSSSYIEDLKILNHLPFSKGDIYYSDDKWDFSQYNTLNVQRSKLKFSFHTLEGKLKDHAKNYVLLLVLENKLKIQSINRNFSEIKKFFYYLASIHVYEIDDVTTKMVKDYIQIVRDKNSIIALRFAKGVLKGFFMQYSANFKDIVTPGLLDLFEHDSYKKFKAHQEQNKSEEIPQEYFDRFMSAVLQILNNEDLSDSYRGAAGVYVIMAQTGLRVGEVLGLKINALKTIQLFDGEEANYLEYQTWKREDGNNTSTTVRTFVNEICKKAFLTLSELYKERRKKLNLDYLYMGGEKTVSIDKFPIDPEAFRKHAWRLLVKMDDLSLIDTINLPADTYPMLTHASTKHQKIKSPERFPKGTRIETLTYPDTQQFRFHVCTELDRQGVPLRYIQKFMSHLTFDMERYHVNPTTTPQEDMEYSTRILRDIVKKETKILGNGKGLSDKIQEFIDENGLNVDKDLETICQKLADRIPIRQKTGGVCIKSSRLRECPIDAPTNEFYCAYGVCPNIFHFYYMVDITYRQYRELKESIALNKKRGHGMQVQKETNMICTIISSRLIPEMEELKNMIQKYGIDKIYKEHPEVQEVTENYNSIMKEAQQWISQKS